MPPRLHIYQLSLSLQRQKRRQKLAAEVSALLSSDRCPTMPPLRLLAERIISSPNVESKLAQDRVLERIST